jgi:hypothetical protein
VPRWWNERCMQSTKRLLRVAVMKGVAVLYIFVFSVVKKCPNRENPLAFGLSGN